MLLVIQQPQIPRRGLVGDKRLARVLPLTQIASGLLGETATTGRGDVQSGQTSQHIVGGYDSAVAAGTTIAGTPDTVRAELERQIKALGVNHMNLAMFFGNMKLDDALRSQKLFATEVMPKLAAL